MAVIVRNTFIDIFDESKYDNGGAQRRSSSEPPGCSGGLLANEEIQGNQQACSKETPESPFLSPRSDDSTTASYTDAESCTNPRESSDQSTCTDEEPLEAGLSSSRSLSEDPLCQHEDALKSDSRDFCVCVNKIGSATLGIDVKRDGGIALLVKSVSSGGLVDKWNQENPPHLRVEAGNHIVTVNGVSGTASDMLKECQRGQVLHLRVIAHANLETLATLVSTLPKLRKRRKDPQHKNYSPSEPSQSTASTTDAASQGAKDEMDALDMLEASSAVSTAWSTSTAQVPELSLVSLLPMASNWCPSESTSLGSCAGSQPTWRTKLKSSSPLFAPACGGQGGEIMVSKQGVYGEMSDVLTSTARALTFNPDVQGIQVVESELGSSASIHIELAPITNGLRTRRRAQAKQQPTSQIVSRHVKSALLDVAAQSQNIYVVGYLDQPFTDVGDSSFKATLAYMRQADTACTVFYEKGRCDNRNYCQWCHPTSEDLMVVWVNIRHEIEQH